MLQEFTPKLFLFLKAGYTWAMFRKDLIAGLTVSMIALPLSMAFAIASGVTPTQGLITAIVAGFLISALGGSRLQISGPTGAFVVILYDCVQRTGYEGLAAATVIAGLLLVGAALLRLGSLIQYVPHPLVTGFTSGIAVMIFSSQIKDFFGLQMGAVPTHFADKWIAYISHFATLQPATLFLGATSIATIVAIRLWAPKLPWAISALGIATALAYFFDLPVETVKSKFGVMSSSLPWPSLPSLSPFAGRFSELMGDAIAIAFLAGVESLLSAVVADRMTNSRHKPNCELLAQGLGNLASVFMGGIPATGAISRTTANIKTGAQTPIAGMIHAVALLGIVCFCAPLASLIPLTALASVLIALAWNMLGLKEFLHQMKDPIHDRIILLAAFFLTVFVDVSAAVMFGMVLAAFLFMRQMSQSSRLHCLQEEPDSITYEIHGPLFFGAAHLFQQIHPAKAQIVLHLHHVPLIDSSGLNALKELKRKCAGQLVLSGSQKHVEETLKKSGLLEN